MNIRELLDWGVDTLVLAGNEDALFDSRELLMKAAEVERTSFPLHMEDPVSYDREQEYRETINKRALGHPLQYLLGEWDFFGLTIKVGEGVLIPRPETEILAELAVKQIRRLQEKSGREDLMVLDLCAGTGCIGLAVASQVPECTVISIEKSDVAMAFLKENIHCLGFKNISAIQADVLPGPCGIIDISPDVILSNPPYVTQEEMAELQKEVSYEPVMALTPGEDDLLFYRSIADNWIPFIKEGGFAAVECGDAQAEDIRKLFLPVSGGVSITLDYQGIERIVLAEK